MWNLFKEFVNNIAFTLLYDKVYFPSLFLNIFLFKVLLPSKNYFLLQHDKKRVSKAIILDSISFPNYNLRVTIIEYRLIMKLKSIRY